MSPYLRATNVANFNLQTFLDFVRGYEKIEVIYVDSKHLVTESEYTRFLYSRWQNRTRSILHEQLQASLWIVTAVTATIECSIRWKKKVYSCTAPREGENVNEGVNEKQDQVIIRQPYNIHNIIYLYVTWEGRAICFWGKFIKQKGNIE